MLQIKVKPLDEHNPEGVLELLNSNKSNLSTLLLQYNTIIETYLKILGISEVRLSNVNEVILPEIECLLNKYDCEFTENGICSNGKEILFIIFNKDNTLTIKIQDGENTCEITPTLITTGQTGLFVNKKIKDFSNLDEDVKKSLSDSAKQQLERPVNPELKTNPNYYFPLCKVYIQSVISSGVECLKTVEEYYKVDNDDDIHNHILVRQIFRLGVDNPIIQYSKIVDLPEKLQEENLRKNMIERRKSHRCYCKNKKQQELIKSCYSSYGSPAREKDIYEKLFYYGESKLYYNACNLIHKPLGDNPFRRSKPSRYDSQISYEEKTKIAKEIPIDENSENNAKLYDIFNLLGYSKLINNLKVYNKKYPSNIHPIYLYKIKWKGDLGNFINQYMDSVYDLIKIPGD